MGGRGAGEGVDGERERERGGNDLEIEIHFHDSEYLNFHFRSFCKVRKQDPFVGLREQRYAFGGRELSSEIQLLLLEVLEMPSSSTEWCFERLVVGRFAQ
jgi:hypothetical protein